MSGKSRDLKRSVRNEEVPWPAPQSKKQEMSEGQSVAGPSWSDCAAYIASVCYITPLGITSHMILSPSALVVHIIYVPARL